MTSSLYSWLEHPRLYRLSQHVLAPGANTLIRAELRRLVRQVPQGRWLDVGCGPKSLLFDLGFRPVGLDVNPEYVETYRKTGAEAVVGSADQLPFPASTFDAVWSVGLLHHLSDAIAQTAVQEMARVCKPGGRVVILDAVLPRRNWARPLAYALRKMDRGSYMRSQESLEQILRVASTWHVRRFTYALTGLELASCASLERDMCHDS